MPVLTRTALSAVGGTAAFVLGAAALATPAGAAEQAGAAIDFDRLAYTQTIRSGAIETYAEIPRNLPQDGGYSKVFLDKRAGGIDPRCQVEGAGFYLSDEVEEGVIKGGAAPIAGEQSQADASPYENPTLNRTVRPTGGAEGEQSDVLPAFPAGGNGPLYASECNEDLTGGTARGDNINAQGFRFAGSTSEGNVDKATGVFTGTGRAYVTGLDGVFDSLTSMMQVTYKPAAPGMTTEPMVTFRMAFFNSDPGSSGFTSESFTIGGADIPASEFVNTFNEQAEAFATMGQAFGPAGLQILSPEVYPDQDSGRMTITAPVAAGNLGFAGQSGTIGQNFGLRFASITYTGDNVLLS